MMPGMAARASQAQDVWDSVWQEYDARTRHPGGLPVPVSLAQERLRQQRGRRLLIGLTALAFLLLTASAYAAVPGQAARDIAAAFRRADRAAVMALVDWQTLRMAATPLPAGIPAEAFLDGLARIVQQRGATPEGLLSFIAARVGPDWPEPSVTPTGLGTARLVLATAGEPGRGIAFSLALRPAIPPRWLVVAVEPLG